MTSFNVPNRPGVYVTQVGNQQPVTLIVPNDVYMLGLPGTSGTAIGTFNTPVRVNSLTEFDALYGADSPSRPDVALFFQLWQSLLFVNTELTEANELNQHIDWKASLDSLQDNISGILILPRAYATDTGIDHEVLTGYVNSTVTRTGLFAIIDPPYEHRLTVGADGVTGIRGFAGSVSPMENTALYFPYLDFDGNLLPPSSAVASLAMMVWQRDGIAQSPAGTDYPLRGVSQPLKVSDADWEHLTLLGVNVIKRSRLGAVAVMGARTLGVGKPFVNSAIIISVIQSTLVSEAESILFQRADNQGMLFTLASNMANRVMYRLYSLGALIGNTPRDAYGVTCDNTNNSAVDLRDGILFIDIDTQPASSVERVIIRPRLITQ